MNERKHTSKEFEHELRALRERLLAMGGRCEEQISRAMRALAERDDKLAEEVLNRDDDIDRDEIEIDDLAQTILATRQPVASDLRFLTMSLKFVTDLERIGDLAANIAKRALELNRLPQLKPYVDLPRMADLVQRNLREVLDSFVTRDDEKAASAIDADEQIDQLNATLFAELIAYVATDPATVTRVIPLTSVARYLERIGDHVKNLAEEVVYMVRGRDIRHKEFTKPAR
jgi:phosphate transport system protein